MLMYFAKLTLCIYVPVWEKEEREETSVCRPENIDFLTTSV